MSDINEKMISKVSIIDTKNADEFLESLHIDENGNLIGTLNIQNKLLLTSFLIVIQNPLEEKVKSKC